MTAYYTDPSVTLYHGDCLDVLMRMADCSIDAVVTDPPYGLEFMGREWDTFDRPANAWATRDKSEDLTGKTSSPFLAAQVNKYAAGRPFQQWCESWAVECLRVLKPGGHLLAFGGSRTWHRLAAGIEDAGFEIRDSIAWLYASGFPKSLDVSKAIDRGSGQNRERQLEFTAWMRSTGITAEQINRTTKSSMASHYLTDKEQPAIATADMFDLLRPLLPEVPEAIERLVAERTGIEWTDYVNRPKVGSRVMHDTSKVRLGFTGETFGGGAHYREVDETTAFSDEARQWQGWGTALKPAFEPIVVGRKPLAGTVAANVLAHGTGALNIDGCRTQMSDADRETIETMGGFGKVEGHVENEVYGKYGPSESVAHEAGRWPANVLLDESQADELDAQSGVLRSGANPTRRGSDKFRDTYGEFGGQEECVPARGADSGGASRFFPTFHYEPKAPTRERPRDGDTAHPTVKPLDLMRWLVRLVCPPGGVVLEPFAGSGTTAEACVVEGFRCIAIEREADYLPLIVNRLSKPIQVALDFGGE